MSKHILIVGTGSAGKTGKKNPPFGGLKRFSASEEPYITVQ